MSDEFDLIAALEQRQAEMASVAKLFGDYRKALIVEGFSTDVAEEIATYYASMFTSNMFDQDEDD